jgi:hypothetical protein
MNEHHTSTGNTAYKAPVASPGGNSPVIGRGADRDRFVGTGARQEFRTGASDHRGGAARTLGRPLRRGEHDFEPERHETNPLPVLAMGLAGGLMLGWFLTGLATEKRRGHSSSKGSWIEDSYMPERSYRSHDSYRAGERRFENSRVATDETRDLIASDKVEGTAVYDRNGERLGSVYNFMVGKRSGHVAYAVMSFGGWLGMAESYHPLPWHTLSYDTERGGYVVSLSKERLRNAPSHKPDQDTSSDRGYWRQVKDYWA